VINFWAAPPRKGFFGQGGEIRPTAKRYRKTPFTKLTQ